MGQPGMLKACHPRYRGGEPGELKHLSTLRKRKQTVIPPVVASERGLAQTVGVATRRRGCRTTRRGLGAEWKRLERRIIEGDNPVHERRGTPVGS